MNRLIECAACSNEIAILSVACPKCGNPNNWIDPRIASALKVSKDAFSPSPASEVRFKNTALTIQGKTETFSSKKWFLWLFLINIVPYLVYYYLALYLFIPITFALLAFTFVTTIISGYFSMTKYSFEASIDPPSWRSSNDEYWKPVREKLEL